MALFLIPHGSFLCATWLIIGEYSVSFIEPIFTMCYKSFGVNPVCLATLASI